VNLFVLHRVPSLKKSQLVSVFGAVIAVVTALFATSNQSVLRHYNLTSWAPPCSAAPNSVNINGQIPFPSISSALLAASNGDVICVGPGTYTDTINDYNKYVVIESSGGASQTTLKPPYPEPVVVFQDVPFTGGYQAALIGFTITGGYSSGSTSGQAGGVTLANGADVQLRHDDITGNSSVNPGGGVIVYKSNPVIYADTFSYNSSSSYGGGMLLVDSYASITDSQFVNNTAAAGGGVWVDSYSQPAFVNDTFSSNSALVAGSGEGGAIGMRTGVAGIIENDTFSNNAAFYGGAIELETGGGAPVIEGNSFHSNLAENDNSVSGSGYGGAIAVYSGTRGAITDNEFQSNMAANGGGAIAVSQNANVTINDNVIYGNSVTSGAASADGGGIYVSYATINMDNNCISSNSATVGGGLTADTGAVITSNHDAIVNNTASNTSAGAWIPGGIHVVGTASGFQATGDLIYGNNGTQLFDEGPPLGHYVSDDFQTQSGSGNLLAYSIPPVVASSLQGLPGQFSNPVQITPVFSNASTCIQSSSSPALSYGLYQPLPSYYTPVYRFFGSMEQVHFFTISQTERDYTLRVQPIGFYHYEGIAFYALTQPSSITVGGQTYNTVPVMRYDNIANPAIHFFSVYPPEEQLLEASGQWIDETPPPGPPAFYVYPPYVPGLDQVCRFRNAYNGVAHFYTASAAECSYIQNTPSLAAEWIYEGIAFSVPYVP
jgi:hypothetical protein